MRAKNIFKNVLKIGLILAAGLISLSLVFAQSTQQIEQNPGTCGNPTGSVTVNAFFDRNANGVRDLNSNEYGLAGFVYTLDGTSQQLVGSTDNNGQFVFFNVPVGNHTITQAPIAGWAPTTTNPFVINVRNGSNQVFVGNRTAAKNPPWNNVEQESLFNAQEIPQRQIPSNIQPQSLEGQTGFKEEQSERNQEQQIQRTSQMPSQQNSSKTMQNQSSLDQQETKKNLSEECLGMCQDEQILREQMRINEQRTRDLSQIPASSQQSEDQENIQSPQTPASSQNPASSDPQQMNVLPTAGKAEGYAALFLTPIIGIMVYVYLKSRKK